MDDWTSQKVLEIDGTISRVRGQFHSYSEVTASDGTKLTELLAASDLTKHHSVTARVVYSYGAEEVRTGRVSVRMVDPDVFVTFMPAIDTALWTHSDSQVQITITVLVPRGAAAAQIPHQDTGERSSALGEAA